MATESKSLAADDRSPACAPPLSCAAAKTPRGKPGDCKVRSGNSSCIVRHLARGQQVDFVVSGIEYTGTLLGGGTHGVVAVADPFEINFIAARTIEITSKSGPSPSSAVAASVSCPPSAVAVACVDPVPAIRALLRALAGQQVLLQVKTTFLQGAVRKAWKRRDRLALSTSGGGESIMRLSDVAVVLVPLGVATGKRLSRLGTAFGDPTIKLTLQNNSKSTADIAVFQARPDMHV